MSPRSLSIAMTFLTSGRRGQPDGQGAPDAASCSVTATTGIGWCCAVVVPRVAARCGAALVATGRPAFVTVRHLLPLADVFPFLGRITYWTETPPYGLKDERLQRRITRVVEAAKRGETPEFGLFRTYSGALRQLNRWRVRSEPQAAKVHCPAVVLHSVDDTVTTFAMPRRSSACSEPATNPSHGSPGAITSSPSISTRTTWHVAWVISCSGCNRAPSRQGDRRNAGRVVSRVDPGRLRRILIMPPRDERRPLRLLLINPKFPESFWAFSGRSTRCSAAKEALKPAARIRRELAALCQAWPSKSSTKTSDPAPTAPDADISDLQMGVQFERQRNCCIHRSRGNSRRRRRQHAYFVPRAAPVVRR